MASIIHIISREDLENIVKTAKSLKDVLNKLNLTGQGHSYDFLKSRLDSEKISYSHLKSRRYFKIYKSMDEILIRNSPFQNTSKLKIKLIKNNLKIDMCEKCGQKPFHNGEKLSLQLDHINGVKNDNRLENLRILCPNCHSQTHTYSGKKRKNNEDNKIKIYCDECKCEMADGTKYGMCKKCFDKSGLKKEIMRKMNENKKKFDVTKEELEKLVHEKSILDISKMFNVSYNAIIKRCKKMKVIYK
jgi:Zn finger protein HypA/HybF involved in hydrogenase expression